MQRATKAELQMLRELAWLILPEIKCWFCKQPIMPKGEGQNALFGHRRHSAITVKMTWHHFNRDRNDSHFSVKQLDSPYNVVSSNLLPAHTKCHQLWHAEMRRRNDILNDQ